DRCPLRRPWLWLRSLVLRPVFTGWISGGLSNGMRHASGPRDGHQKWSNTFRRQLPPAAGRVSNHAAGPWQELCPRRSDTSTGAPGTAAAADANRAGDPAPRLLGLSARFE